MFRLRPKLEVKLNGALSDVQFKPSLKCGIAENIDFRKCRIRALFAHTYIREFSARKLEVKRDALFQRLVQSFLKIQQSNKISILETVELVRERAHTYIREFS